MHPPAPGAGVDEQWRIEGDRFSDSFNPRRAIMSDRGRLGYLKVLADHYDEDPWLEQWANEQIVSELASELGIPAVEAQAGIVDGEAGAITVFLEGRKLSELEMGGFRVAPLLEATLNRDQFGLIVGLDLWVLNTDRGSHNLYVTMEEGRPRIRLIDHGHTLLLPREEKAPSRPGDWESFVVSGFLEEPAMTRRALGSYLRPFTTPEEIREAVRTITQVSDETIAAVVDGVPEEFLFCGRGAMTTLLINRRDRLEGCLEEGL
jgi:hypothetical protein